MIQPLFKPIGKSSHLLAHKLGQLLGEPCTHTGTLDPMANGVLIALSGNDRYQKESLSAWKKEYEFSVVVGISTDSLDLLGLITHLDPSFTAIKSREKVKRILHQFIGTQNQVIPQFSAKRVDGESFFDKAKRQEELPQHSQEIEVYSLDLVSIDMISASQLLSIVRRNVSQVEGDFRQASILENWTHELSKLESIVFPVMRVRALTSKKTYVRGLVRDIGSALNVPTVTSALSRTKNGPYSIQDCICLV